MADRIFIRDYLRQYLDSIEPLEFYRELFPIGELEETGKEETGRYNAIAVELLSEEEKKLSKLNVYARKFVITDDLNIMQKLFSSNNFIIISPITYIGKSREATNARYIYAMAIDLDGITKEEYLRNLFHQFEEAEYLPKPTFIVWSGTGIHLYYQFEKPIPCFQNVTKQLQELKSALTRKIWNSYITSLSNKPQLQSLFQGFRMCGGVTKNGNKTEAFYYGDKVSIEYLNSFVVDESQVKDIVYKSNLTKAKAKELYPEWYDKRIIQKRPRGTWQCKNGDKVYQWWLNKLKAEIKEGHRYYGLMCLAIYAKKCGVSKEQLEKDAFGLFEFMEGLTVDNNNHFKQDDILAALELYNDSYITFPIDSISELTNIHIEKNKRNGRNQRLHLEIARNTLATLNKYSDSTIQGRPSKKEDVLRWKVEHPTGTKNQCIYDTGLSKSTVYKYWNSEE